MVSSILVTSFYVFLSNIFLPQVSSLTCFNCGYLELSDGQKVPVTEDFGKIPFCDDFNQSEDNTIEAYVGGCCSAFKVEIRQGGIDEVMFLSRHGTANDEDKNWANFTCRGASPDYTCMDKHIRQDGIDDEGRVCNCYDEFCNKEVPTPDDNLTPDTRRTTTQDDFDIASYFKIMAVSVDHRYDEGVTNSVDPFIQTTPTLQDDKTNPNISLSSTPPVNPNTLIIAIAVVFCIFGLALFGGIAYWCCCRPVNHYHTTTNNIRNQHNGNRYSLFGGFG